MSTTLGPSATLRRIVALAFLLVAAALPTAPAAGAPPDHEDALQVFNRDVYFLDRGVNLRNPTADTDAGAPLYSSVGAALDLTWGEWQQASATSQVHTIGGSDGPRTLVRMQLAGLIPGGLYSVFYGTFGPDSEHPLCPGVERTLPLRSLAGTGPDPSAFVADALGQASYHGRADAELLAADQVFFSVIYHFDGASYHPLANRAQHFTQGEDCRSSYGEDAMRQLLVLQKW